MANVAFASNKLTDLMLESYFLYNAESGTAAVFKLMLLGSSFTPSKTHQFISDVVAHEVTGAGYTAGGKTVTITVGDPNNTLNETRAQCAGTSWPNSTVLVKGAVLYKVKAGNSTHQIVGSIVYDTVLVSAGTELFIGAFEFPLKNLGTLPA